MFGRTILSLFAIVPDALLYTIAFVLKCVYSFIKRDNLIKLVMLFDDIILIKYSFGNEHQCTGIFIDERPNKL